METFSASKRYLMPMAASSSVALPILDKESSPSLKERPTALVSISLDRENAHLYGSSCFAIS